MRLAVVVSHVIQYFCPQYVSWASLPGIELRVFFGSRRGLTGYHDPNFGQTVQWQGLNMDFPHEFIPNSGTHSNTTDDRPQLDQLLDQFAAEAVLVYGWNQQLLRRAVRWARRNEAALLMLSDAESRSHRNWFKSLAKAAVLPRFLRQFDVFLTVGDSNEEFYRRYGVPDTRFVRCGFPIDCQAFDRRMGGVVQARNCLRTELGIPSEHKVVLNVGKLVPWKRQKDLVEFSNQLLGKRDDVTVVLVGSGRDEGSLLGNCKKRGVGGVVLAGFIQPSNLVDYYLASDIYAVPAEHEPHSLAISEAIYAGLPVVISDRCGSVGPSDDVRPGINGFAFPCSRVRQMSDLILHLFDSPELLSRFSNASQMIGKERQAAAHREALMHAKNVLESNGATNGRSQALRHRVPMGVSSTTR